GEINLGGVLPGHEAALARLQDLERDLHTRCKAVTLACEGMRDQRAATAVLRLGHAGEALDLAVDPLLRDHLRRPERDWIGRRAAAVEKRCLASGHSGLPVRNAYLSNL